MGLSRRDKTTIATMIETALRKGKTDDTPIGVNAQEVEQIVSSALSKMFGDETEGEDKEIVDAEIVEEIDTSRVDTPAVPNVGGNGVIDTPGVTS